MLTLCGTCKHGGKVVGYNGRGRGKTALIYCERYKKPVPVDYVCLGYESETGKKLI